MHPTERIEHLLVAVIVMLTVAASYVFRGKWRTMIRLLAGLFVVAYAEYFYRVTDEGEVEQRGYSSTIEGEMDFLH